MTDDDEIPPLRDRTRRPSECGEDECDVERFSKIGMEYHLLRDHAASL